MASLDLDSILRAQASDDEDEDGEEGILDANAFDRRLEEILNADVEEEEDEGEVASTNPFTAGETEIASGRLESSSQAHDHSRSNELPAEEGDISEISSHSSSRLSDDPENNPSSVLQSRDLNEDGKQNGSPSTDASIVSPGKPVNDGTPCRQPTPYNSSQVQAEISGVYDSFPRLLPNVITKTNTTTRPGAALAAAAAGSRQVSTTHSTPMEFLQEEPSIGMQSPTCTGQDPDEKHFSEVIDTADPVYEMLEQKEMGEDTQVVLSGTSSLVCSQEFKNIVPQADDMGSSLLLAQGIEAETPDLQPLNDSDDEDDDGDAFDIEHPFAEDSTSESSDDDLIREEIQSFLSQDLVEVDQVGRANTSQHAESSALPDQKGSSTSSNSQTDLPFSTLDVAEEAEKNAAFADLQVNASASQAMRLKGLQTGPPPIRFLHVDHNNAISQVLSSSLTIRDNGVGQAVAIHGNNLAVGLSKGSVLLLPIRSSGAKFGDALETKPLFLTSADKSHSSVTSLSFNMQGDLLLVGHANGFLALWEISSKGGSPKPVNSDHNAAIINTAFLCTRVQKAITADCRGLVLLHSISSSPFGRYSVTSQCLLDGQNTGMVLCLAPLLVDMGPDSLVTSGVPQSANITSTALTSMVGGMVRGVVASKNSVHEGATADEAGNMVVFVTHQYIIVFRLPPMLQKVARLARPDGIRDGGIPYIAWRQLQIMSTVNVHGRGLHAETVADEESEKERSSLLVLGWDKKVFVLQLFKGEMKILVSWDLDSVVCGVTWLDEQIVAIVTSKEQIYLFTKEGLEVERVPMESDVVNRSMALSYHTHVLNIFGNPEKTYHSSLAVRAATMYLLGPQWLWRARLLAWHERLKALQDAGDWLNVFHVGMELFDGKALAVVGLPKGLGALRTAVTPTLLDLLSAYIDEVFTYLALAYGSNLETAEGALDTKELKAQAREQYARVGGVAIEFCVHIQQTEVLFDRIFHKFCAAGQRGTFLELLEPYILQDTLGALAPEVMQGLVEHYKQMGWVQRVERCVLHMDIASLDFNQVVRLCRDNGLYSALIYVFNKGLDDFKSPLEELLILVRDISNPHARIYGYKLLVYLKYCFSGLAFPPGRGAIQPSRLPALRSELLLCLLDNKPLALAPSSTGQNLPDMQSLIHPRLSCLLAFDQLATLEVLRHAFPEEGLLGLHKESLSVNMQVVDRRELNPSSEIKDGLHLLQDIVGALTDILERIHLHSVDDSCMEVDTWRLYMSKIDAGHVMEFIAGYIASNRAKVPRVVLTRILEYLATPDRKAKRVEKASRKEGILVSLLNGVPGSEWDSEHILELAMRAHFWQATGCLLAKKGNYVAALDSYMKDKDQRLNGFLFILDVLSREKELTKEALTEFRGSVLARLPELLQLSSEATLVIMLKHFSKEHKAILSDLAPYPPLLFQYLKQIMNARLGYKFSSANRNGAEPSLQGNHGGAHDAAKDFVIGDESLSDLLKNAGLEFSKEMEEPYVELLCKFEPTSVLKFLKSFEDYRLEHCLKLCQDHGITDAAAYLLERVGDIGSALTLVLGNLDHEMHEMDLSIARVFARQLNVAIGIGDNAEQLFQILEVARTCSIMQAAVELCQRNTWRMYPGESEALWFCLLDRFVDPLRKLHDARKFIRRRRTFRATEHVTENGDGTYKWKVVMISRKAVEFMQRVLVYLIGEIINGMMGYVPLSAIMDKLLLENGKHEFGDFKGTILQMLGLYGYEQAILFTAKHVVEDDMFHKLNMYKQRASRGYAPCSSTCCVCNRRLDGSGGSFASRRTHQKASTSSNGTNSVIIFSCGHSAHSSCIFPDGNSKQEWTSCPSCPPSIGMSNLNRTCHKHT